MTLTLVNKVTEGQISAMGLSKHSTYEVLVPFQWKHRSKFGHSIFMILYIQIAKICPIQILTFKVTQGQMQ